MYVTGKCADVKYGIASFLKTNYYLRAVIFDFCRSNEEYISYEGIEAVKNGIFFATKYESDMVMYNQPHIIVFANFPPDLNGKVSNDRWIIYDLNDKSIDDDEEEEET